MVMLVPGRDIFVLSGREYLNLTGRELPVWPINNNNKIYSFFFASFINNKSVAEYRGRMLVGLQYTLS